MNSFVGGCYLANKQDDTDSSCVGVRWGGGAVGCACRV